MGHVLFLLHIADIARGISVGYTTSSYMDDTTTGRSKLESIASPLRLMGWRTRATRRDCTT